MTTRTKGRAAGEGTIYQEDSGRWRWKTPRLPNRKRLSGREETQGEAREALRRTMRQLEDGYDPQDGDQTVAEYMTWWLDTVAEPNCKPSTMRTYRQRSRDYIVPTIGRVKLRDLKPAHVLSVHAAVRKRGVTESTVERAHTVLRSALSTAVETGTLRRNPALLSAKLRPTPERPPVQFYEEDELAAVLASAKGHRLYALVAIAAATGMRQGELLGLTWEDVDLDQDVVHVRYALQRTDNGMERLDPKSKAARRTIPLAPKAVQVLRTHHTRMTEERLAATDWEVTDFVFVTQRGTPLDQSIAARFWYRVRDEAGARPLPFKALRSSYATRLAKLGRHPKEAQELLGHEQMETTMRYYTATTDERKREAAIAAAGIL